MAPPPSTSALYFLFVVSSPLPCPVHLWGTLWLGTIQLDILAYVFGVNFDTLLGTEAVIRRSFLRWAQEDANHLGQFQSE